MSQYINKIHETKKELKNELDKTNDKINNIEGDFKVLKLTSGIIAALFAIIISTNFASITKEVLSLAN